ncbi:hypothetical protein JR316_0004152 [Psilocybe cubensis]|uniref:Uncharacterized protein n=2 Tax=Psilocybe cubensis TaxID=181762 RepID=A0A8H7XXI7_PSICU|nr:hypothetical protein JR316_0004152 [Psilocybe cubensis]KAH9482057.1 hypothetical protein JR316_0004152 [Psilocybe cubensis]
MVSRRQREYTNLNVLGDLGYPVWFSTTISLLQDLIFIVSDTLLIWRCFHVWQGSLGIVVIPSLLFLAESALTIVNAVYQSSSPFLTSSTKAALENHITTALSLVSLCTTVTATFLIGYKIHSAAQDIGRQSAVTRYGRIANTVIESSAVYALALFLFALTTVVPLFYPLWSPAVQVKYYVDVVTGVVSGLAPTVMVLRLALPGVSNSPSMPTLSQISGLGTSAQRGRSCNDGTDAPSEQR